MKKSFNALLTVLAAAAFFAFTGCNFNANGQDLAGNTFRRTYGSNEYNYYQFTFKDDGTYEFIDSEQDISTALVHVYTGKYTADRKLRLSDEKCSEYYSLNLRTNAKEDKGASSLVFHNPGFAVKYKFDGEKLILKSIGWEEEYSLLRK